MPSALEKNRLTVSVISVMMITLAMYVFSMPRSITLEDAGLFQMICHNGGIGHPPGYPLFVLGCQAFVPLFGPGVMGGNLLSALFATMTCGMLVLVANELLRDWRLAVMVALIYGFSATFWSQSIIVEVYSLASLLFVVCLYLCLRFRDQGSDLTLYLLVFFYALGLSNHWPLHVLATPALLVLMLPYWRSLLARVQRPVFLVVVLVAGVLGLSPYLSLFVESPGFAVFGGINSVEEFVGYVTRSAYDDQFAAAGWSDKIGYQGWVWMQTLREFSWFLAPVILLGIIVSFREFSMPIAASLVLLYLGATTLLVMLLGFEFNDFRVAIFKPYPTLAYIAPALWIGFGCRWMLNQAGTSRYLAASFLTAIVLLVIVTNVSENDRSDSQFAQEYGERVLALVPEDAVLFVEGDVGVGLIGYLHHVLGLRQDLELRSWNNLVFSNRLAPVSSSDAHQNEARRSYISQSGVPVFSTTHHGYPVVNRGIVFEHRQSAGFDCPDGMHDYIRDLIRLDAEQSLVDGHEKELLFGLLLDFARQHVGLLLFKQYERADEFAMLSELQTSFAGKLATLETMMQYPQDATGKKILSVLASGAEQQLPKGASSQVAGVLSEYRGRIALLAPEDKELAVHYLEESVARFPAENNTSLCLLSRTYQSLERTIDFEKLSMTYPSLKCN